MSSKQEPIQGGGSTPPPFLGISFFNLLGVLTKNPKTPLSFPVHTKKIKPSPLEKFLDTPLPVRIF